MTFAEPGRLYSAREAAAALRCSEWWLKEQARRRRIPFLMLGGCYRFTVAHLAEIVVTFEVRPVASVTTEPQRSGESGRRRPGAVVAQPVLLHPRPPRRGRRIAEPPAPAA